MVHVALQQSVGGWLADRSPAITLGDFSGDAGLNRRRDLSVLGMVFTEFLDMVEQQHSPALVDQLLKQARPASGGAYTAVGSYPHQEMVQLVVTLSQLTGQPVADLLRHFGEYLFGRFLLLRPDFFEGHQDCMSLLATVDSTIHHEVSKLYRTAELPQFIIRHRDPDRMTLEYRSVRHLADLAEGLIRACIRHFSEPVRLTRIDRPDQGDYAVTTFELVFT